MTLEIAAGIAVLLFVFLAIKVIFRQSEETVIRVPTASYRQVSSNVAAVPPSVAKQNWLIGLGGDVMGRTFHIGARTVTIGRGVGNYIQTTDGAASRVHCQLQPTPQGIQLKDMDSANGTFVNGRLADLWILNEGDEITIGEAHFRFQALGKFNVDHAKDWKMADQSTQSNTQFVDATSMGYRAQMALAEHRGDVFAAAQSLGITVEALQVLVKD